MGIHLNDQKTLYTLHYADDQVVITQDKEDVELMTIRQRLNINALEHRQKIYT